MLQVSTVAELRRWRVEHPGALGFVPTMGFLHDGHMALVERARAENERLAVSIFVNPSQFGEAEDLATYPRDLARDVGLLAAADCDLVFTPEPGEIYPPGFQTWVQVGPVAEPLEGAFRPGHFRGVATVVLKLFGIVQPTRAYFGQKDAQQLAVVQRVVADLNVPVEVVPCATVREPDGLAMSSRNSHLDGAERRAATVLYRALVAAREAWRGGLTAAVPLRRVMWEVLDGEPLAATDYVSVADPATLRELEVAGEGALLSLAVRIGRTRLIDNLVLDRERAVEAAPARS